MAGVALSNITAIVLAGGTARRMGQLGTILPKALLTTPPGQTLLTRNVDFLLKAGIKKIVISVLPEQMNLFSIIIENFKNFSPFGRDAVVGVEPFSNPRHQYGPVPALGRVIEAFPSDLYVLCLSDIYFFQDPFSLFDFSHYHPATTMLVGPRLAGRGGVIATHDDMVSRISYAPIGEGLYNWTGSALFGNGIARFITDHSKKVNDEPIENIFLAPEIFNVGIQTVNIGRFINVNSFADLVGCFDNTISCK